MSVGLIPHYSVDFSFEGITTPQFLSLAAASAKKLNWNVENAGNGLIAYTPFRRRSINEKIYLQVVDGLVSMKSESQGGVFVDWGRNKKNIDEFIRNYDELRASYSPEQLNELVESDQQSRELADNDPDNNNNIEASKNTKGMFSLLIPVKGYSVTPLILNLNFLVFLLMIASGINMMMPDNHSLLNWGANFRPYTLDGQAWRLFTNFFLHIGIVHLLFNMYALLYIGILLEPRVRSWRFGLAYFITGFLASVSSLYWHPMTISAGASGAIFGMYGVFLAMLTTNLIEKNLRKALLTSIAIFVGYNLLNGLKEGIDNAAHLGGLISGLIIGYSFYPGLTNTNNRKLNYGLPAVVIISLLAIASWTYHEIPDDIARYDLKMKSFFSMEAQALEVLKMPKGTSKEKLLSAISDRGLYYWEEDKKLVTELDKLDLPPKIHEQNRKLVQYCDLRIASYQLLYKAIDEGTTQYKDQIKKYNYSIDSLIRDNK